MSTSDPLRTLAARGIGRPMAATISSTLSDLLSGRQCKVQRREADWNFSFGEDLNIGASVPWRIVTAEGIGHGHEDDGQWFGLPQPVDGEAKANGLLGQRSVVTVEAVKSQRTCVSRLKVASALIFSISRRATKAGKLILSRVRASR